jgi:hypothetical protein
MVDIFFNGLQDCSDHGDLRNSSVCFWIVSLNKIVHPDFTYTFAVDADALFEDGERFFDDIAGDKMESLQTLRINMQSVREWNVSNSLESERDTFDVDFS